MGNPFILSVAGLRRLIVGDVSARWINRRFPSSRRCKQCLAPFRGLFSVPYQLIQIRPSRKNPNLCTV